MRNNPTSGRDDGREDFYDNYWDTPPKKPAESADPRVNGAADRESYYARRDAYYAERDAYYAERDAFYARRRASGGGEDEYDYYDEDDEPAPARSGRKRRRRRRRRHPFRMILTLLILAGLAALLMGTPPRSDTLGERIPGRSAVLLVVVGADGRTTDSVTLVTMEQRGHVVRTLAIPGDMYAEDGLAPRMDEAYGSGGIQSMMKLAEDLLGYAPDGYFLLDAECLERASALAGLPWAESFSGTAGEVLTALRQLATSEAITSLPELWRLFQGRTRTDLTVRNLCWVARVLVKADLNKTPTQVLPGRLVVSESGAYRTVDRPGAAALRADYSPYL